MTARIQVDKTISAPMFKKMLISGAKMLDVNKAQVDALNVFPVPDGDTGTNMSLTLNSAIKEINMASSNSMEDITNALSKGALKGARGNSGVILSQILKGVATTIGGSETIDAKLFAKGLKAGVEIAYGAVVKPKEGTILTVARVTAEYAVTVAKKSVSIITFFENLISKSEEILAQTPEMLDVLKKAGVVDSGGYGFVCILKGLLKGYLGEEIEGAENIEAPSLQTPIVDDHEFAPDITALDDIEYGYCTELFVINIFKKTTLADIDRFREYLNTVGDSVIVIGDLELIKVHVHTNKPGKVLSYALNLGELGKVKIENMLEQFRERKAQYEASKKPLGVLSICAGDGFAAIFKDLLADQVIEGGQTMNPSADDIAQAINRINAESVIVLPNNKNIILAAEQARALVSKRNVYVVPSKDVPQGLAAILAYNSQIKIDVNFKAMNDALSTVRSASVTYAVRNTSIDGMNLKQGDIIGLEGDKITRKGKKAEDVAYNLIKDLINADTELITLYYGQDTTEEKASALAEKLENEYPDVEFITQYGGQPLYYYIISAE